MSSWQSIETAPDCPDGKLRVMVFDPSQRVPIEVKIADGTWWRDRAKRFGTTAAPTHWMPLPEPPTGGRIQAEDEAQGDREKWQEAERRFLATAQAAEALEAEVTRLQGLRPELPPYPPEGHGLPRYGLRWNGPDEPLAVPMDDGYWTPFHLAERQIYANRRTDG